MSLIELRNVSKVYSLGRGSVQVHALKNINLTIDEGELLAIMGPSGSGKSTLMNILGCLDRPTSGEYRLDGQAVNTMSSDKLATIRNRMIGFVFQSFNLLPRYSAVANVEMPLVYAGVPPKRRRETALRALEMVGLSDRVHHKPAELSGGQQQRVAIARALVGSPKLILADEPTGNLDTASSMEIMDILCSLNKQGITVVLVTHEPDIASLTPRVLTLRDGVCVSDVRRPEREVTSGENN